MSKYRIRAVPQDGRPLVETIEVDTMEHALAYVLEQGLTPDAIELVDIPDNFEPNAPVPSAPPRPLPPGLTGVAGSTTLTIIGAVFTLMSLVCFAIGLGLLIAGLPAGFYLLLIPSIHFAVGLWLLSRVLNTRRKRRRIYSIGVAAAATIDRTGYATMRINNRRPYEIGWTFYLDGRPFHDKRATFSKAAADIVEGQRLWVLFDPEDPTQSVEWPAM